jgi:hypothetical protein
LYDAIHTFSGMVRCWRKYDTPINENQWVGFTVEARKIHLLEPRGTVKVAGRFRAFAAALRRGRGLALDAFNVGLQRRHVRGEGVQLLHEIRMGGLVAHG